MIIVGCDFHPGWQQIAVFDSCDRRDPGAETGERQWGGGAVLSSASRRQRELVLRRAVTRSGSKICWISDARDVGQHAADLHPFPSDLICPRVAWQRSLNELGRFVRRSQRPRTAAIRRSEINRFAACFSGSSSFSRLELAPDSIGDSGSGQDDRPSPERENHLKSRTAHLAPRWSIASKAVVHLLTLSDRPAPRR